MKREYSFYKPVSQMKFKVLLYKWLQSKRYQVRTQTYYKYEELIQKHISPHLGDIEVEKISSLHINEFIQTCQTRGNLVSGKPLSNSYIRTMLYVIGAAYTYGENKEFFDMRSSCRTLSKQTYKKELVVLSELEQVQLHKFLVEHLNASTLGILISLHLGLRIGEICALHWSNIDFNTQTLKIDHTVIRTRAVNAEDGVKKTILQIGMPKTRSSQRTLPIPTFLFSKIEEVFQNDKFEYLLGDAPLDPRTYQYRFKRYLKDCNITAVNFHVLRHTFATKCVESGMDVKTLSEVLGHSNVQITLNTYVHSSLNLKRKELEKLSFQSDTYIS